MTGHDEHMKAHDEHTNDRDDSINIVVDTPRKEHGREHQSHMDGTSTEHGGALRAQEGNIKVT